MSTVLKQGMNLPAFNEELKTLVEKHGGVIKHGPILSTGRPTISNERFGPYDAKEVCTPIEIEVCITVESIEVVKSWRGA